MKTRRIKIVPFPVADDGAVELPDGAVVVALEFEDEGGLGYGRRPVTAWGEVPVENDTTG